MYLDRLYFRKDTGTLIYRNYKRGLWTSIPTVDEDFASLVPLQNYVKDAVEVIEVPQEDIDTQNKLDTCVSVSMDISTKALIFSFTTPEASLESVKIVQKDLINQACQNLIVGGFHSSAYQSADKLYDSTLEDQANIQGNALSAVSKVSGVAGCENDKFYYHAHEEGFVEWTAEECLALARDFKIFKEGLLTKCEQLKAYIYTLTTVEEVQKVTWDTVIPT